MTDAVDFKIANGMGRRFRLALNPAAQRRAHARHQLAGTERLVDEIVGAEIEGVDLLRLAVAGRQHDDRGTLFEKAIALSSNDPQRWAFYTYGALALILKGEYERALECAGRAAGIPNRQYWTLVHKAVALARLGRPDEARRALDAALVDQPELSVSFARRKLYYVKQAEQLERYLEGLASAGAAP